MITQDFILLIMNCKKYAKKALFQKQTWIPKIPSYIKYFHVIGDINLESDFKFDNENNILWVKVEDDYNSLPKKVITAYDALYNTYNFKYLYKTDDDQILVNDKFFDTFTKLITSKIPKTHYGGYIVDVQASHISKYYIYHPELPKNLLIQKSK